MCKSLIVSDVFLMGTQLGTQNDRKRLHISQHDTNSTIEGGGGRPCRRPSSSHMDKSVWKIFAKERSPRPPRFCGFPWRSARPVAVPLI